MKVLGITSIKYGDQSYQARDGYIVEISHDELQRAFERGYSNEMEKLKVGAELDLGSIPEQHKRVADAAKSMQEAHEKFLKASVVMADMARIIGAAEAKRLQS